MKINDKKYTSDKKYFSTVLRIEIRIVYPDFDLKNHNPDPDPDSLKKSQSESATLVYFIDELNIKNINV